MDMPDKLYYKDENGEFQELTNEKIDSILGIDDEQGLLDAALQLAAQVEKSLIRPEITILKKSLFQGGDIQLELCRVNFGDIEDYCVQVWYKEFEDNNGYITLAVGERYLDLYNQYQLYVMVLSTNKAKFFTDCLTGEVVEIKQEG